MTQLRDDRFLRRRVGAHTAHTQTLLTLFKSGDEAALPGLTSSAATWFDVADWTPHPVVLGGTTAIVFQLLQLFAFKTKSLTEPLVCSRNSPE